MVIRFGVLGNGSQAKEMIEYFDSGSAEFRAVSSAYLDPDDPTLIDIETDDSALLDIAVVSAAGAPALRKLLVNTWAGTKYQTVVASSSWISSTATLGAGSVIAPQSVIGADVYIGSHVLINFSCSVSHDSFLGDYVTLSPGVNIAGSCHIGDGVFVGVGASVSHGVTVASGTVVGAGAVVISDIDTPGVYVGVPARRVREQEGWLSVL